MTGVLRAMAVRAASRVEQEIRAHDVLLVGFYRVVGRSARARALAGRIKSRVRQRESGPVPLGPATDAPDVVRRRRSAVAARLGLGLVNDT